MKSTTFTIELKSLFGILFSCLILSQGLQSLITIAIYKANVKEITANFCVNKSKPMMHCNGKCHLKKELKEQEKSEKKNPYQNKENRLELNDNMGEVGLSHFFADPHSSLFSSLHYQCNFTSPFISIDSPPPQLIA